MARFFLSFARLRYFPLQNAVPHRQTASSNSFSLSVNYKCYKEWNWTYTAVVEAKLFTVRNVFVCKHANWISPIPYFIDGLAVWAAWMTESTCIVPMKNRVDCQNVKSFWIVKVALECYVVEVRQVFRQFLGVLSLFDHVLLLKPMPRLVDFTEVFYD